MAIKNFTIADDDLEDLIHAYCRDFTDLCRKNRFDPITGRDVEIDQTVLILLQKGRKNCCYLAPAGVGKTALVAGLSQQIVSGNVPEYLRNARVLEVDLASMAAGTESSAEFQGRFVPMCRGFAERYHYEEYPKYILFFDEVHTIMPTATGSAYKGLSEVMKPYLTVGDLQVLAATTLDEYRVHVAEDPALDRRFQKIHLKVPDERETFLILQNLRGGYEKHHHITIPDECLELITRLTGHYLRRRNQPDKSIVIMDAACAHAVKENGRGCTLSKWNVKFMLGKEANINPKALED